MEDDVQMARRERRRRKILENSEDRFRRLTNWEPTTQKEKEAKSNDDDSKRENIGDNQQQSHDSHCSTARLRESSPGRAATLREEDDLEENYTRANCPSAQSSSIRTLPKILTENKACTKAKETSRPLSKSKSALLISRIVLWRKGLVTLLAFSLRLSHCVIGELAVNNFILIPMTLLEVLLFTMEFMSTESHNQQYPGTMTALLLLLGIKWGAEITRVYNSVTRIFEDYTVFIFVFFLCHWLNDAIMC